MGATPTVDARAVRGSRMTGFPTKAMCSTTRAALMSGCNHHRVGMGCLANFDGGCSGYRSKIASEAATLAEMLSANGYVNYAPCKWHVTPLSETGFTGPFDGWPLGRVYNRICGFMDTETDPYAPQRMRDDTPCSEMFATPGSFASGYHLSPDHVDQSIRFLADHQADQPAKPWHFWLILGVCHAPHQAPAALIRGDDTEFAAGWDAERQRRLARQPGRPFIADVWEPYLLDDDFAENHDLAPQQAERPRGLVICGGAKPTAARCCRWTTALQPALLTALPIARAACRAHATASWCTSRSTHWPIWTATSSARLKWRGSKPCSPPTPWRTL